MEKRASGQIEGLDGVFPNRFLGVFSVRLACTICPLPVKFTPTADTAAEDRRRLLFVSAYFLLWCRIGMELELLVITSPAILSPLAGQTNHRILNNSTEGEITVSHSRTLYRLVQAVACVGSLALPGVASAANFTFIAVLNSGQEIQDPKPTSNSLGTALLTLSTTTRLLCYSISYTDLLSTETAAHFHAPASAGQNGDILFFISPPPDGPSPLGSPKTGCVGPLTDKQMKNLTKGLFYINVHSETFPAGEIRGQVLLSIAKTRGAVAQPE
jgi:CHRD domain